jgi:O-acetyl-ADP-ribose deacetylase (regulator of RNase III)
MPIIFVSLSETFCESVRKRGFKAYCVKIQDYDKNISVGNQFSHKKTYYVSPANSLCFMDGGIDLALSRIIFPGIEKTVKQIVNKLGITNLLGRNYLPIGSSIIVNQSDDNKFLIVAPTMLLPQNVANTKNAYYCTQAVLYNILINGKEKRFPKETVFAKEDLNNVDIVFTSLCCGYGCMTEEESIKQIMSGIEDYKSYNPKIVNSDIVIKEPNLNEQPKYYENTEWIKIEPKDIKKN